MFSDTSFWHHPSQRRRQRRPSASGRVVPIVSADEERQTPERAPVAPAAKPASSFEKLRVSEVFCPTCRSSQPVCEVKGPETSEVSVFHVVCETCGTVVGQRTITQASEASPQPYPPAH